MNISGAIKQGFRCTKDLWFALVAYLVVFSIVGSFVTLLIPYEVVDGQIVVPTVTNAEELVERLVPALVLYAITFAFSVYILGGVLGCVGQILRKKPTSAVELLINANRRFLLFIGWGAAFFGISFFAGFMGALGMGFVWIVTGQSPLLKPLIELAGSLCFMTVGMLLLYSPVILVEKTKGVWSSFSESRGFLKNHMGETVGLVLAISLIGAIAWLLDVFLLAPMVAGIQKLLGIPPFSPGFPVFFFNLILGLPMAFIAVFLPSTLYAFYHENLPKAV